MSDRVVRLFIPYKLLVAGGIQASQGVLLMRKHLGRDRWKTAIGSSLRKSRKTNRSTLCLYCFFLFFIELSALLGSFSLLDIRSLKAVLKRANDVI